jgi:glycosyltransferase involved in cell wall biosynthesis
MCVDKASIASALQRQSLWVAEIEQACRRYSIVSTLPYRKVPFWTRIVREIPSNPGMLGRITRLLGIPDPTLIARLLYVAPRADLVLLTGGERADLIYAAIASLCPWVRTPHVVVDAHWQRADGIGHALQRLLLRLSRRVVHQIQPHSEEEVPIYAEIFGIESKRLYAIPWSTSLLGHAVDGPDSDDGFILAGGFSFRDYAVFLPAAAGCGFPVRIGIPASQVTPALRAQVAAMERVSLHTDWSNAEYLHQMKRCKVFAMPIVQGLNRSTADQTILNAMFFGKPVVASDSIGPRIYIRHGENGFLVREPSVQAWGMALKAACSLPPADKQSLAARAAYDARVHFNEEFRLARTIDAALLVLDRSHRPLASGARSLPSPRKQAA